MSNEVAKKSNKERIADLMDREDMKAGLAKVLPQFMDTERFTKIVMFAVSQNPKLGECTPLSFTRSIMQAAQLGLDCSGADGQGYLVAFRNKVKQPNGQWEYQLECQFMPGYQGLADLARRSERVIDITAQVVYENDEFDLDYGKEHPLSHRPNIREPRGKVLCAYALARLKGTDAPHVELMTLEDLHKVRASSKSWKDPKTRKFSTWEMWFEEMCRKSTVRRICKYIPKSPDLILGLSIDNEAHGLRTINAAVVQDALPDPSTSPTASDAKFKPDKVPAPKAAETEEPPVVEPDKVPAPKAAETEEPPVVEPDKVPAPKAAETEEPPVVETPKPVTEPEMAGEPEPVSEPEENGPPVSQNEIPWIALEPMDQVALLKAAKKNSWDQETLERAIGNRGAVDVAASLRVKLKHV